MRPTIRNSLNVASITALLIFIPLLTISATAKTATWFWKGGFDLSHWKKRWSLPDEHSFGWENFTRVQSPSDNKNYYLRVVYPEGSFSPSQTKKSGLPVGGAQFISQPSSDFLPAESLRLRYEVMFEENFDFVKGGKLPGLYGGDAISGGDIPDGTNGFSARLMWRENGAGEVYAYLPTSEEYGTSIGRGSWYFQPGQWHTIDLQVQLNDVGSNNGSIVLGVDGKTVIEENEVLFRTVDTLKIDGIFFSTFFGGSDSSWATPKTTYVYFDNFKLK